MDYKKAYFELYNELSDLVERLQELQQRYEEKYISAVDKPEHK